MDKNIEIKEIFGTQLSKVINSIKHTPESFSKVYSLDLEKFKRVIKGIEVPDKKLLQILENHDVININDLYKTNKSYNPIPDKKEEIEIIMKTEDSLKTTRTFSRGLSDFKVDYYHYSDLAASKFASILPEHIVPIQETKCLIDNYGEIPDWAFNKGHLEHQITYFSGEIDFHWIENGKKYSRVMKNSEMNYIFPYTPHTFTTRNYGSYIAAVTYKSYISSPIGLDLILNSKQKKGTSLFDCIKGNFDSEAKKREYVKFLPSIKKLKHFSLSQKSLSPFIKYETHILEDNPSINERWTYFIKPPFNLKTKSKADDNFHRIIGNSIISNSKINNKFIKEKSKDFIQIGLNKPKIISLELVSKEVKSFYRMHGIKVINRIISDNSKWF